MYEELTDEQIEAMSYKQPPIQYFACYDKKTGEISAVTNALDPNYPNRLEIDAATAHPFLSGEMNFIDYVVTYGKNKDKKLELMLVPKVDHMHSLQNKIYEQIVDITNLESKDFIVEWTKDGWNFILNATIDNDLLKNLMFFITYETNVDALIRTITIDTEDLFQPVHVPFTTLQELNIDMLAVSTKSVFGSYGLRIIHD